MLEIEWLGYASFKLKDVRVIYIDPYKIEDAEPADIILLTRNHYLSCSPNDIKKIRAKHTAIIGPPDCATKFPVAMTTLKPHEKAEFMDITITAIPAYTTAAREHHRALHWLGYVIKLPSTTVYHAGYTDHIPEMKDIKTDIMMVPVNGRTSMDPEEAAEAVHIVQPKLAIPMGYEKGSVEKGNADEFEELCELPVKRFD